MNPVVWNLSALYGGLDDPAFETDIKRAEVAVATFAEKWEDRTDYLENASVLREALEEYEVLYRGTGTGPAYFLKLSRAIDQTNSALKGRANVVEERTTKMSNRLTFFEFNLGQISPEVQSLFLMSSLLAPYHVWLKRCFENAAYDLSIEATNLLNTILPQAVDAWGSMIKELLSEASANVFTGEGVEEVAFNGLPQLLTSSKPRVVEEASVAIADTLRELAPIAAHELNAIVTTKLRLNRHRGYDRPDAKRFLRDDLDAEVVEAMLVAVTDQFSLAHEFYDLKAHLMDKERLSYYQRASSYGSLPEGFTFEQASDLLRTVLAKLHPHFAEELERALSQGRIDALPRKGKLGGAMCSHSLIEHPTYLLLNFTGQLRDVQTFSHEFGHYLNNVDMQSGGLCDGLTFGATLPMAEVASTFFEKPILDAILEQADAEMRLAIMVSTLSNEVDTIFRQAAAMRFEQELYTQIDTHGYLS